MTLNHFRALFLLLAALGALADFGFAQPATTEPDDRIPSYLTSSSQPESDGPPSLHFRHRIVLQDSENLSLRYFPSVIPAEDGYYVLSQQGLVHVDTSGRFIRILAADLLQRRDLSRLGGVAYDPIRQAFSITDFRKIAEVDVAGSLTSLFELSQPHWSLDVPPNGGLLVTLMSTTGPYAAIVKEEELVTRFASERHKLLGPDQEFRPNFPPRFYLATDSRGEIYAVNHVDYEIRKYSADGKYLGDFRLCADPDYRAAPKSVDKERLLTDPEFADQWLWTWGRVVGAEIVEDRYLVVELQSNQREQFRLHFYTLEGQVAFEPITWSARLADVDSAGNLYFEEKDDSGFVQSLAVYGLGSESPRLADDRVPAVALLAGDAKEDSHPLAPSFTGTDLDGQSITLEELRGKVVVLNFWFLACAPCRAEIPELNSLVERFRSRDVVFLALAPNAADELREFLKAKEFLYRIISDPDAEIAGKYKIYSAPVHMVIDQNGGIDSVIHGAMRNGGEDLGRRIEALLGQ